MSISRSRAGRVLDTFRGRLLHGFGWNLVAAFAQQGSVLLSTILVARLLGLEQFGLYTLLVSTVSTLAAVAQGGCGIVATKYVAEHLGPDPARVARILGLCRAYSLALGLLVAASLHLGADVLSALVLGQPDAAPEVRMVALAVVFLVTLGYQIGALQGFGAFRELGRAGIAAGLLHVTLVTAGAWIGGVTGALFGFVAASACRSAATAIALARVRRAHGIPSSAPAAPGELRTVLRFALPAGLAGLVTTLCLWLATVLVARLPGGLALVATLSVAHQLRLVVLQLPSLLNAVSFSVLSRLKGSNERDGYASVFWSNLTLTAAFSTLVVATLIAAADPLLQLYGRDFAGGRWILVILLLSTLPEILAMSVYQLIQSAGRMWRSLFLIVLPRDLLYLALAASWLDSYGVIGIAGAYLAAQTVGLAITAAGALRHPPTAAVPT